MKATFKSRLHALAMYPIQSLPDFMIIGAQKAGTTSLFNYLLKHRQILSPRVKEPFFFDRDYENGLYWYRNIFPSIPHRITASILGRKPVLTGEGSTGYLDNPSVPGRVYKHLPQVKLMVLLRDPTARAVSHYKHNVRKGREPRPFHDAVSYDRPTAPEKVGLPDVVIDDYYVDMHYGYFSRGLYATQLKRWARFFPMEQILVLQSEEFFSNTKASMKRVTDFLEIEPINLDLSGQVFNKATEDVPIAREDIEALRERYRPHNDSLNDLLGNGFSWNRD